MRRRGGRCLWNDQWARGGEGWGCSGGVRGGESECESSYAKEALNTISSSINMSQTAGDYNRHIAPSGSPHAAPRAPYTPPYSQFVLLHKALFVFLALESLSCHRRGEFWFMQVGNTSIHSHVAGRQPGTKAGTRVAENGLFTRLDHSKLRVFKMSDAVVVSLIFFEF